PSLLLPPPTSLLFPYTTLFRSSIHLTPLSALGMPADVGYTAAEYLAFYERAFGYILELNRRGVQLAEATASTFLGKMLTSGDATDRKSTRLNSSHVAISYAVFC